MPGNCTESPSPRKAAAITAKWPVGRPAKPYEGFPLTPHGSEKWVKRIRGTTHYFGAWAKRVDGQLERLPQDGGKAAIEEYQSPAR